MLYHISPQEILPNLSSGCKHQEFALVDVRSPREFLKGALPNFVNIPILDNTQRAQVGTCYKYQGREQAIVLGHALTRSQKDSIVNYWAEQALKSSTKQVIFLCWRGGLRSQISSRWLQETGIKSYYIAGGYKAVRNILLQNFCNPKNLIILNGLTGSGKTELLQKLAQNSINLEYLAKHSGSAFGNPLNISQPTQQNFENNLALELFEKHIQKIILEDESKLIGRCAIPQELFRQIQNSPRVILEVSISQRIENILSQYVISPLNNGYSVRYVRNYLCQATQKISKKLGGFLSQEIQKIILTLSENNFTSSEYHYDWIKLLLINYYDKAYCYSFEKYPKKIIFQGDFSACYEFLQEYVNYEQ